MNLNLGGGQLLRHTQGCSKDETAEALASGVANSNLKGGAVAVYLSLSALAPPRMYIPSPPGE